MLADAPAPERGGRPRQFLDRVFTIKGAGTVVTGTLTGGPLAVGQEVEILPSGHRARIRGLQTHKRSLELANPVSRVAVNLAGTPRDELERGDVLALPGQWRSTSAFEGWIRPVRDLDHPLTARGAYKLYAGSAERDARIRLYEVAELRSGQRAFARIILSRPVVLDVHDNFVLREAGRQRTVAGGEVLDTDPPSRPGHDPAARLRARAEADRPTLAWLLVADRGIARASDVLALTGAAPAEATTRGAIRLGGWLVAPDTVEAMASRLVTALAEYHSQHPLRPGLEIGEARSLLADVRSAFSDPDLADAFLAHLVARGDLVRDATVVRLPSHTLSTAGREDADRLVQSVRIAEPSPPSVRELVAAGFSAELIRAVCAEGRLVRVSPDIVITPDLASRAEALVRTNAQPPGVTVSAFKEALGTSRKYALPILEYFDAKGLTRRHGDFRLLRG